MKFTAEELVNIAIEEYDKADFLQDGAGGFTQREGIREWAWYSAQEEYASEDAVREEVRFYIAEEKSFENE